jgi:sugar/nucleoside kinase (ribokinase family)
MLLGCVGNDAYGYRIRQSLEKAGVKPLVEVTDEHKTSRCAVAIHLKERCLMPQIMASTMLSMDFVEKNLVYTHLTYRKQLSKLKSYMLRDTLSLRNMTLFNF